MTTFSVAADVVVVGGGPVGLAAAIEARLAGLSVVVVEPRTGPIDKACGEGLMPGAVPLLERLGVRPHGHPLAGVGYYGRAHGVEHRFTTGSGLGVRRTVLHAALAERAAALGVDLVTGRADAIEQHQQSVTVAVGSSRIVGCWLLGCDGLHSTVARLTALAKPGRDRDRRYGIRQHFAVEPWSDLIEVHYGPTAELYVTPVAEDTVGVAMLASQGTSYTASLAEVPAVAERLAGAAQASERRGAGPFRQRTRARSSGRVLLVGDASGYVDALTGEGLRVGFAQASAAVAVIVAGDPRRYERDWRRITRDFRLLTTGLVGWADSPARAALVPTAARLPGVFGAVVERLAR
jgi:flavin-dependent dehydrogenase